MSKFFRPKPSVISNQYQKWLFDSLPNLMIGDDEAVVTCTFTLLKMATLESQLNLIGLVAVFICYRDTSCGAFSMPPT
jgi:hypothetical protein